MALLRNTYEECASIITGLWNSREVIYLRDRSWPSEIKPGEHVIQIYTSEREKLRALSDILRWGKDDLAIVYFSDYLDLNHMENTNSDLKMEIKKAIEKGNMKVFPSLDAFCVDGKISIKDWRTKWSQIYEELTKEGFQHIMKVVDFSWASCDEGAINELIILEAHSVFRYLPDNVTKLCQYDSRLFSENMKRRLLAMHEIRLEWETLKRNFWLMYKKKD